MLCGPLCGSRSSMFQPNCQTWRNNTYLANPTYDNLNYASMSEEVLLIISSLESIQSGMNAEHLQLTTLSYLSRPFSF